MIEPKPITWEMVCKRTNDPKLAWIERQLTKLGIPNRRRGESFHAPILEIHASDVDRFWVWFSTYDDMPDDDPKWST